MLLQRGMSVEERDFFKNPLSEAEVRALAAPIGLAQLFARRSPSLKELGLADQELSEGQMLELMLKEPRLIRRPLVRIGGQLLVGASPKAVEAALAQAG